MSSFEDIFGNLDGHLRRCVMLSTVTVSGGVALLPAILRASSHGTARALVMGSVCLYIIAGVYRLLSCFQTEKHLGLEERFLRFCRSRNRLLASVQEGGTVWRQSVVVQAVASARSAALTAAEGPTRLRGHLRNSVRLLMPASFRRAVPALALVAGAWTIAALLPDTRLDIVLAVALPVILILGFVEVFLMRRREAIRQELDALMEHVQEWAAREWTEAGPPADRGFQHRVVFRDTVRRG